ncbi:MAG: hypothetical protein IKT81_01955, partial [Clostridia bacterium]|nr:hypothetical protein [Clostridia bacterium]
GGGTHSRYCRCGAYQTGDCVWDDGVVTTEPTHTEPGTVTFTCTLCGHTYTEEIPVTPEHQWGEWVVNKQDEANTHIRYCTCDETQTAAHNFDNGAVTTEATHTSKGEMTYTCADCGYTYTKEIEETPEHSWTDWSDNSDGTHSRACRCNATETAACAYDDGAVTQAATHYEEGETTYTCTVCGGTMTEAIAKTTEHEWSEWASTNSTTHIRECKCGETQSADHNYDNGVVTKQATHLETGVKTFTCQTCGFVREETIAKTAEHSFGSWQSEATVVGKHYRECACGQRETADCTFDDGVVTAEPTYDADGTKTYTCQTCGGIKTESIDKLVKTDELIAPDNSGIKINAPDGTSAILNQNTVIQVAPSNSAISEQVKTNVVEIVGSDSFDVLASYDISLLLDGAAVQPGGKVEVTLPAPANADEYDSLQVVYIDDMGNVTPCETRVNADGSVTFITDHFSRYAIIGVQDSSPVVWILISVISVVLIAAAVIAVLGIRKKKGIA